MYKVWMVYEKLTVMWYVVRPDAKRCHSTWKRLEDARKTESDLNRFAKRGIV